MALRAIKTIQAVLNVIEGVQKFLKMMIPQLCTHYMLNKIRTKYYANIKPVNKMGMVLAI